MFFCVVGHERDQEGKYRLEGGSERGSEGHGVESKGGIMDSDQQQFCLKWNSFGTNLLTASLNLFKSESLTDVTLFCEGKSLNSVKTRSLHSRITTYACPLAILQLQIYTYVDCRNNRLILDLANGEFYNRQSRTIGHLGQYITKIIGTHA